MTERQIINLIEDTLEKKIKEDENFIKYSFFELTVKYNLNEKDKNSFLELLKIKLENNNYNVYTEGQNYEYNGLTKQVKENELLIGINCRWSIKKYIIVLIY